MKTRKHALVTLALAATASAPLLADEPGVRDRQRDQAAFRTVLDQKASILVEMRLPGIEPREAWRALTIDSDGLLLVQRRSFGGARTIVSRGILAAEELADLKRVVRKMQARRAQTLETSEADARDVRRTHKILPRIEVDPRIPVMGRRMTDQKSFAQTETDGPERRSMPVKAEEDRHHILPVPLLYDFIDRGQPGDEPGRDDFSDEIRDRPGRDDFGDYSDEPNRRSYGVKPHKIYLLILGADEQMLVKRLLRKLLLG